MPLVVLSNLQHRFGRTKHLPDMRQAVDAQVAVDAGNLQHDAVGIRDDVHALHAADDQRFFRIEAIEIPERALMLDAEIPLGAAPFLFQRLRRLAVQNRDQHLAEDEAHRAQHQREKHQEPSHHAKPQAPHETEPVQRSSPGANDCVHVSWCRPRSDSAKESVLAMDSGRSSI